MKERSFFGIVVLLICGYTILYTLHAGGQKTRMMNASHSITHISTLFDWSVTKIAQQTDDVIAQLHKEIAAITATDRASWSYATIARTLDTLWAISDFALTSHIASTLEMLSPDKAVRDAAHAAILRLQNAYVDTVSSNKALYLLFKAYADTVASQETLSEKQRYFIAQTVLDFERAGLQLPDAELAALSQLKKEIAQLGTEFGRAIAQDISTVTVTKAELAGLSDDALALLTHDDAGTYTLRLDYPTVDAVLQNCAVESTRQKVYLAFVNRAYPENHTTLANLVAKRHELAQMLGFASYAAYDLSDQMALTPERATAFITDLADHSVDKEAAECAELVQTLPESVTLTGDGKIKPWDISFIKERYKQEHYQINQEEIAEYFPVEKTIMGLFKIYESFFDIKLTQVALAQPLWHPDVRIIQLRAKNDQLLGTILLDLFPRENKYSHACHMTIIQSHVTKEGTLHPGLSVVVANFPKPNAEKPALLKLNDVKTFFHEFGHALHAILGATEIISMSGTNTKRDFVELPSQILEEWLGDKEILQLVSSHYATGAPLPSDLIDKILSLKHFDSGSFVQRQVVLSLMSLNYYGPSTHKDFYAIAKELHHQFRPRILFAPEDHMYASFGHLPSYAAKYYGYLWSRVFALDIFAQIKEEGLLNPAAGKRYCEHILAFGGTKDPNELLYNYLGRKPNNRAFLHEMGLDVAPEIVGEQATQVGIQQ